METEEVTKPPPTCHRASVNSTLMQCLNKIDEPQYSMPIDCGISEPTCLVWSKVSAVEDTEGNYNLATMFY